MDVGWFSHAQPFEFDIHNFEYAEGAARFSGGTPSIAPFAGACASHALLSGKASEKLQEAPLEEFVVTNSIDIPEERRFEKLKVLSVAGLLSRAIMYIHENESVSQLFELRDDD